MFSFTNHTVRNGTPWYPHQVPVWAFSDCRPTQQNNYTQASPSIFDKLNVEAVKNSVWTHTRNAKRGCQNKNAYRIGVMQTNTDIVDSFPLLKETWNAFWSYFCATTRLCSNFYRLFRATWKQNYLAGTQDCHFGSERWSLITTGEVFSSMRHFRLTHQTQ